MSWNMSCARPVRLRAIPSSLCLAVSPELATFPDGWEERLVPLSNENTGGITGWCVEVHDLAVSKLAAGRDKDFEFVRALLRHRLATAKVIDERLNQTSVPDHQRELLRARLRRVAAEAVD